MANISDKVAQIRQAVYGKDVRESIASSIEAINSEVETTTAKQAQLDTTFEQLIINAGNSNAEIVAARVDANGTAYPTLGDRLNNVDTQLKILSEFPLNYPERGNGLEKTISEVFPHVTLSEVQQLNPSATLSDTADWYILQKLINEADVKGYKRLNFPPGIFILSKPLDFTGKLSNCIIEASGCCLRPSTYYNGELVKLSRGNDYSKCRNLRINGLQVDGLYRASVGININDAHEWYLNNVKVYNCFIGIKLVDTYYGELSGECIIQNCLVGIQTDKGKSGEVNTIDFRNTKINFATDKRNFIPQNPEESDVEYDNRVISKAIELNTLVFGCKFDGLIIEGMDYGYYGTAFGIPKTANTTVFSIINNYFEAIKKNAIYLVSFPNYGIIYFSVNIEGCRFHGVPTVTIGEGYWKVLVGQQKCYLNIQAQAFYRTYLETDLPSEYISSNQNLEYIFIHHRYFPTSANALKYNAYNNNNNYPTPTNMLPTIQDERYIEHVRTIRTSGARSQNSYVFSIHTKPLTFLNLGNKAGPVIQGEDGKFYMITTKNGTSITLQEVKNLSRLDYPVDGKTSKELYRRISTEGESFYNVDINEYVVFKDGKWKQKVGTPNEIIALGTTLEIAATTPPNPNTWYSPRVWNVQIESGYNWQGSYWAWGPDWYGNLTNIRAIGPLASRPTNPNIDKFIYYATDEAKYYIWSIDTNSYSEYTPLF